MEVKIRTLTPIWTGDVERESKTLRETSIIGSLRWWFEAIVRGLGGYACDGTNNRCEYKDDINALCPVCQVFGTTGWSRRFRFEIEYDKKDIDVGRGPKSGFKPEGNMAWKFHFISKLSNEQKWLFKKTLWIIENYGAIGGRTTWKPNGKRGTDYGLIKIEDYGEIKDWDIFADIDKVKTWLEGNKRELKKENNKEWFNFRFYWIVDGVYLNRKQINEIVGRDPNTGRYTEKADEFDRWLGGEIGVTKKIFSFKNPSKVFGYVRERDEIEKIRKKIENLLGLSINFKTGEEILEGLK